MYVSFLSFIVSYLFITIQVQNNQLTSLPDTIKGLRNLEKLVLSQNQLTTLPDGLFYCSSLLSLNLSRNHLTKLSNKIGDLSYLQELVSAKSYSILV
jgi:Leucine-rich repeat (LRR) protein